MKTALGVTLACVLALGAAGCGSGPAVLPPTSARAVDNQSRALPANQSRALPAAQSRALPAYASPSPEDPPATDTLRAIPI